MLLPCSLINPQGEFKYIYFEADDTFQKCISLLEEIFSDIILVFVGFVINSFGIESKHAGVQNNNGRT